MLKNTACVDPLKIRIVSQSALFYLWENTRNSNKYYNTPLMYSKQRKTGIPIADIPFFLRISHIGKRVYATVAIHASGTLSQQTRPCVHGRFS